MKNTIKALAIRAESVLATLAHPLTAIRREIDELTDDKIRRAALMECLNARAGTLVERPALIRHKHFLEDAYLVLGKHAVTLESFLNAFEHLFNHSRRGRLS